MKQLNNTHFTGWNFFLRLALLLGFIEIVFAYPAQLKAIPAGDTTRAYVHYFETQITHLYDRVGGLNGKTYLHGEGSFLEGIKERKKDRCCHYSRGMGNRIFNSWIAPAVLVSGMRHYSGEVEDGCSKFIKLIFDCSIRKKSSIFLKEYNDTGLTYRLKAGFEKNTRFENSGWGLHWNADGWEEGFLAPSTKAESGLPNRMRVLKGMPESKLMTSTVGVEDYAVQIAGLGQENIVKNNRTLGESSSQCDYFHVQMKLFGAIKVKI